MQETNSGVTAPKGFRATGIYCGIKKLKKDLALVVSDVQAHAAGVFTQNLVAAAPVVFNKELLAAHPSGRAIVVNSGNANACTGDKGMEDARSMAATAAQELGIDAAEVFVSSTGVIGQRLPIEKIIAGIRNAVPLLSADAHTAAAEAIMTTDTFVKEAAVHFVLNGKTVTIGGMAKGSGMIAPNMATMLAFVTTDVQIHPTALQAAVKRTTDRSFNRITVDGDTSTNDMAIVLANGLAGNPEITSTVEPAFTAFCEALEAVLVKLSKMIVMDGEGATKFIEIRVVGGRTESEATQAARSIANSNLVKTAINGEDANWGRILAAVGYSGIQFDPGEVTIHFGDVPILTKNYGIDFSEEAAAAVLHGREITITVDLHQGNAESIFWTCDLSKEYVAINANYRT